VRCAVRYGLLADRSPLLLAGLVLVRHVVSFQANIMTTARSRRRALMLRTVFAFAMYNYHSATRPAQLVQQASEHRRRPFASNHAPNNAANHYDKKNGQNC
jgi:hypothetical protein